MGKAAEGKLRLKAQDRMSRVVNSVSKSFPKLSRAVMKTNIQMKKFERDNRRINRSLKKTGRTLAGFGKNMTLGATLPLALFAAAAIKTGITFEKAMNKVGALTGETGAKFDEMRAKAMKLGSTTAFTAGQAADAMAFLGQAGFKTNEIMGSIDSTLALAAASGTDLARSADIMSNVMGGFNINASESARVADVLAAATAKGNVNMEQIAETMKDAAPVALKFGASLEETAALTAKLGDAGIQGSKAGTTLKQMFLSLAAPTTRIKKIMKSLEVDVLDPATGKMRSMTDILVDLNKGFESKGIKGAKKLAVLNEIFGKRAIAGAGVLLNAVAKIDPTTGKAVNTIKKLNEELLNATGTADKMSKRMLKGLGGAFTKLGSAFEGMQLAMLDLDFGGKKLGVRIVEIVNSITAFISKLSTTNKGMLKWAVIIGAVIAVLGPIFLILGGFIALIPSLVTGFGFLATAFGLLGGAINFAALPLLPLTIGLALLVAAGVLIFKNWKPIKKFFHELWDGILDRVNKVVKTVKLFAALGKRLFGFGSDEEVSKAAGDAQKAFGIPQGNKTKSEEALKASRENKARDGKARLAIEFSGDRQGTRVMADNRDGIIENMTGAIGTL